jgi:hypothetical protein
VNCLLGLASNYNPPDLNLPSSWDYRHESLAPASVLILRGLVSAAGGSPPIWVAPGPAVARGAIPGQRV